MSKTITLRLSEENYNKYKKLADRDNRPISNFIETAVKRFIEHNIEVDEFEMEEIRNNAELNKSLIMVAIDNVLDWYINFLENNEYFNMLNEGMIIFPENSTYSKPFQFVKYDENISQEILQICDIWGIRDYLFLAIDLIKAHFPTFQDINITFDKDQEVDEEWLTLDVTIKGEIDEILDEYDKYSENFIYSVPWPERDKIRLSYDIV